MTQLFLPSKETLQRSVKVKLFIYSGLAYPSYRNANYDYDYVPFTGQWDFCRFDHKKKPARKPAFSKSN